jgi:hypothetical protein
MSYRHSEVHRMQIDDLVDRPENQGHQRCVILSGLDRRPPHPFVQATYLGEQRLNLIAFFATQQRDPVGGIHRPLFDYFVERGPGVSGMASDSAPLASHDEAIDEKQHDSTDHAPEEAR